MSDQISESMSVEEIMARIRERVRLRKQGGDGTTAPAEAPAVPSAQPERRLPLYDLSGLRHHSASSKMLASIIGVINPRPPGVHNTLIQLLKKFVRRLLTWYTRPLREFGDSVAHSLTETTSAIENLQTNLETVQTRLVELAGSQKSNLETVQTRLVELEGSQKSNLETVQRELGGLDGLQKTMFGAMRDRLNRLEDTLAIDGKRASQRVDTPRSSAGARTGTKGELQTQMEELLAQVQQLRGQAKAMAARTRKPEDKRIDERLRSTEQDIRRLVQLLGKKRRH